METISAQEFQSRYGNQAVNKFQGSSQGSSQGSVPAVGQTISADQFKKLGFQPTIPMSPPPPPRNLGDVYGNAAKDMLGGAAGAVKGVVTNPFSFAQLGKSDLVNKAVGMTPLGKNISFATKIANSVLPESVKQKIVPVARGAQQALDAGVQTPEYLKPKGTAENTGYNIEKLAEFAAPGGAAADAGKAAELGLGGGKLAQIAGLGVHSAADAAIVGGQTAVQQGKFDKNALTAGGVAALFPLGSKLLSSALEKVPESAWSSILKRTSSQVAKNPNLPEQAAQTGLTAFSKGSLAEKASSMIQGIETQLDDVLSHSTGKISVSSITDHLDALKEAYAKIPGETNAVNIIDGIKQETLAKGSSLTPLEANQFKRDIYGVIGKSYGKGFMDIPAKTEAQKTLARALKTEIEKVAPEAKGLNAQQAVYIQIKKAIDRQMNLGEGKGVIPGLNLGVYDILSGISGAGLGHGGLGSVATAAGGVAAKRFAESTPFLTNVAKIADHFNSLSPTKKLLFYKGLQGLVSQGVQSSSK